MTIIIFIIILTVLVLVHELGHFLVAKKNGVLVEEFGFGYPPRIFAAKIGQTLYSINLIPLGGFVKLYGEEYHEKVNIKLKQKSFTSKKPKQKIAIIVAGIIGNFLLGWILISYLFTQGVPTPTNKVIVEQSQFGSPAQTVDIKPKDVVTKIITASGQTIEIKSTDDLISQTKKFIDQPITLEISRNGTILRKTLTPRKSPPKGQGPLGIVITSFIEKKFPWYSAPFYGLVEAFNITKKIIIELLKTLFFLLTFQKPSVEVSGPIGIALFTSKVIQFGKNAVLELVALLSLNLAVVNLLPFPVVDGGRLVFVIWEWVTKRRVNQNLEKYLNLAGFAILITLAVIISINDIIKIYK